MASKGKHTESASQQRYVMENSKHLTPVSVPSRPRRKIVIAVCIVVAILVVAVLIGTLVPIYMVNSSEKARSKEKLQEKVKESIQHPDGSVSEIKFSPEPVSTTAKIVTSSPSKVLSANNKASSFSSVSFPSTPPVLEQSVTSQRDSNSPSIAPTRSTARPVLSHIASLVPNIEAKWSRWTPWNDCTKTCGGGTRFRTRNCVAQNQQAVVAPISCAGNPQQNKTCAEWSCPDCNKNCTTGTLNAACDACTCADHVLTGRVLTESVVPLSEANISLAETPYNVLAQTNVSGFFTALGVCAGQQELLVVRAGYVPLKKNATVLTSTTATLTSELEIAVRPFVTVHPQDKIRMAGQSVTLCCDGEGNPPPEFEWFKGNNIIDKDLFNYNNTLKFDDVRGLNGSYRCRVVNEFGSEFSDAANLKVLEQTTDTCASTPKPKNFTLPPGCVVDGTNTSVVDIGMCEPVACWRNDAIIIHLAKIHHSVADHIPFRRSWFSVQA